MYNVNFKNIRKNYWFGVTFLIAGLIFFIIFFFIVYGGMLKKNTLDSKVQASGINENKIEGENTYSPIYYFIVDDKEYSCKTNYSSSIRVSKEQNMVYFDSSNPNNCVTDYTVKPKLIMIFTSIFPLIFVGVGLYQIIKAKKRITNLKYLQKYGTLIKNLPYEMVPTNLTVNNRKLMAINVQYTLPDGTTTSLRGDARYDYKDSDADGFVDLLIDNSNPKNYYLDFNITIK